MEENIKNWKKSINLLKKTKKTTMKLVKQTVQDLILNKRQ